MVNWAITNRRIKSSNILKSYIRLEFGSIVLIHKCFEMIIGRPQDRQLNRDQVEDSRIVYMSGSSKKCKVKGSGNPINTEELQ